MEYAKGKISIPNVTGNVVVTVTTLPKRIINLFDASSSDNYTPKYRITGSYSIVASTGATNNIVVTHLIPVSPGETISVVTDTAPTFAEISGDAAMVAAFYDAGGNPVSRASEFTPGLSEYDNRWTFTAPGGSCTQMRLAIPYTDLNSIVVTAD